MVLDSNPIVGVDLGPDVTDHAEKLSQDTLPIPLLGTLHALNLTSGGLLHFSRQVPLRAHGLGDRVEERKKKADTEKGRSQHVGGRVPSKAWEAFSKLFPTHKNM